MRKSFLRRNKWCDGM